MRGLGATGAPLASLVLVGALSAGLATPAVAQPVALASWTPNLATGEPAGVRIDGGTVRLTTTGAFLAPVEEAPMHAGAAVPTGLLTLRSQQLPAPTDQVVATVIGDVPAGSTAVVDVRGRRSTGGWTEWVPTRPDADALVAELPEPTSEVQGRLVLAGPPDAGPTVRGVTLTARPATKPLAAPRGEQGAFQFNVFATREGLVGGTTANGHVITERDHFVALPSRRGLSPRDTSDYSVKVCAPNGRCAFAPVWDVGPWNTRDDYWNPESVRQEWTDLPQGLPQAQAAYKDAYNDGKDQSDREVRNPAGIDLADGLFWDALELTDNAWVTVDYLWTGSERLSTVVGNPKVLAAPHADAEAIGIAADQAAVPVQCELGKGTDRWLRIGNGQYLSAEAVPDLGAVKGCPTGTAGAPESTGTPAG
jgi:hypothetical protein